MKKKKKTTRYRKLYPGENEGITQEMRFVAMRLRNIKGKYVHKNPSSSGSDMSDEEGGDDSRSSETGDTWIPTVKGFVNYLVDSKLVFDTIERVIDESDDVACEYFLHWFGSVIHTLMLLLFSPFLGLKIISLL